MFPCVAGFGIYVPNGECALLEAYLKTQEQHVVWELDDVECFITINHVHGGILITTTSTTVPHDIGITTLNSITDDDRLCIRKCIKHFSKMCGLAGKEPQFIIATF